MSGATNAIRFGFINSVHSGPGAHAIALYEERHRTLGKPSRRSGIDLCAGRQASLELCNRESSCRHRYRKSQNPEDSMSTTIRLLKMNTAHTAPHGEVCSNKKST